MLIREGRGALASTSMDRHGENPRLDHLARSLSISLACKLERLLVANLAIVASEELGHDQDPAARAFVERGRPCLLYTSPSPRD